MQNEVTTRNSKIWDLNDKNKEKIEGKKNFKSYAKEK